VVTKVATCGISELLLVKKAPGQVPHLTVEALAGLKERLATGTPFKSYGEIVEWLKTEYNLELTYATVYAWVHYRLQALTESATSAKCFTGLTSSGAF